VEATLTDGKAHEVDSSAQTFEIAAQEAFREAQIRAGLMLLEPIMNVVVHGASSTWATCDAGMSAGPPWRNS